MKLSLAQVVSPTGFVQHMDTYHSDDKSLTSFIYSHVLML